jgi:hypothetical protein
MQAAARIGLIPDGTDRKILARPGFGYLLRSVWMLIPLIRKPLAEWRSDLRLTAGERRMEATTCSTHDHRGHRREQPAMAAPPQELPLQR